MERRSGRKKTVTEDGKGVKKRGEGLDTGGPVGRKDGYAGRSDAGGASSTNRPQNRPNTQGGDKGIVEDLLGGLGGSTGSSSSGSSGLGGLGGLFGLGGSSGSSSQQGQSSYSQNSYNQGHGSSGSSGGSSGGGSMKFILLIVVVIAAIFIISRVGCGESGFSIDNSEGTPDYSDYNTGTSDSTGSTQSGTSSSGYSGSTATTDDYTSGSSVSDLFGMLSGYTGTTNVSEGWSSSSSNTTAAVDTSVVTGAREKRTNIIGGGQDTITIMVYMCGTDLESKSGMASNDLAEMAAADISDNVNIIVYTGGCNGWKTSGISSSVNQVYRVRKGEIERLVSDDGSKAMTDPSTLSSFISWTAANFPANRYDLIFWDHGGGSISGYGYDEKYSSKGSMTLSGINKALSAGGVTFDFIGFDTCLMATLETAMVASKYADYMVASEETEPGIGWYYTDWLTSLCNNTSQPTTETGKNIIDTFVTQCARSCQGQKATLSLVDLAELEYTVPDKLSAFSTATAELIKNDNYQQVSNARAGTREFASSSKIDQIDLVNFANNLGTTEAQELADTLLSAIKYNRTSSNMTNAYGLSIYFPYKRTSQVASVTNIYEDIGMDEDYARCIQSFAGLATSGQVSTGGSSSPFGSLFGDFGYETTSGSDALSSLLSAFLSGGRSVNGLDRASFEYMNDPDVIDLTQAAEYIAAHQFDASYLVWTENDEGQHVMAIPDEQWELIQSLQMNMFYDDGEGYIDLGLDYLYEFTDDGRLIGDTDDTWISIDGQPVAFYYEGTIIDGDEETITGRVPALLNGERVNLIIVFDNEHPGGYIAGARYEYVEDETDTEAKSITELEEGDVIDFICDYYSYDKEYQNSYLLGDDSFIYHEDAQISNTYVGEDTVVTYLLTDMYGQEFWTPVVPK